MEVIVHTSLRRLVLVGIVLLLLMPFAYAADKAESPTVENDLFKMRLMPRTAEQMAAFYEGRGFPKPAINKIKQACFITVIIRNKSNKVLWLELSNWHFFSKQGEFARLERPYWKEQWSRLNLPQSHQATFGWTLLPEERNLQPNESVGGNITLPKIDLPIEVEANFITGTTKRGPLIKARFENIRCARD